MEYTFEPEYEGVIYLVIFDAEGELEEIIYCEETEEGEIEIFTKDRNVLPASIWEDLEEKLAEKMQEQENEEHYADDADYYASLERWIHCG